MHSKQRAEISNKIVIEKSSRMVRFKIKIVFLTAELCLRSEKWLPRVVFGAMFRETGSLPWVLFWRTDKDKAGESKVKESTLEMPSKSFKRKRIMFRHLFWRKPYIRHIIIFFYGIRLIANIYFYNINKTEIRTTWFNKKQIATAVEWKLYCNEGCKKGDIQLC